MCNEHAALMKGTGGDRKGGQECGIRICNQKYMFLRNDEKDGVKFCVLGRAGGGGAVVAKTNKALLVGVWGKDNTGQNAAAVTMSNGKVQNTGDCEKVVMNTAKTLFDAGY